MLIKVLFYFTIISIVYCTWILRETADHINRPHYFQGKKASNEIIHEVVFAIKQNNLDEIEKLLYDVSTPSSLSYGQHLSFDEVGRIVTNRQATSGVLNWLKSHSVDIKAQSYYGEYITARASVLVWEKIFDTTFHEYHPVEQFNTHKAHRSVVRALSYSLPEEVNPFIHTVLKLINLPPPIAYGPSLKVMESNNLINAESKFDLEQYTAAAFAIVYPYVINLKYNITGTGDGYGNQSIYASIGQTFLPEDLSYFQRIFGLLDNPIIDYIGPVPNNSVCYDKTSSDCDESSLDVQYIASIANDVPTSYFYDPDDYTFLSFVMNLTSSINPTNVYSISYSTYETFLTNSEIKSFNTEAMKLGLRGVTLIAASGDDGVTGYLFRNGYKPISQCGYYAQFPASSPYVTALGGTIGGMETYGTLTEEVANSVSVGGGITTGGGFSNSIEAPSFQTSAIDSYKSKYSAKQSSYKSYNYENRGYPDLSMTSNNYLVIIANHSQFYLLSGTSASAPVFAAMVSLVNADRLQSSHPVLGWLNPSIYINNGEYARDVTSGSNVCTANSLKCCLIGFKATEGWDPVTGFGSVDYPKFLSYYRSIFDIVPTSSPTKAGVPTRSPTTQPTSSQYIQYSYLISQKIITSASAEEFLSSSYAIDSFEKIILDIFSKINPSFVTIDNAINIDLIGGNRKLINRLLTTSDGMLCNYTIGFYSSNAIEDSYIDKLTTNVTTTLYNAIINEEFTNKCQESSSSILSTMTISMIPYVSDPTTKSVSTKKSSKKSSKNIGKTEIILIAVIVGGVLLIALIIFLTFTFNGKSRISPSNQVVVRQIEIPQRTQVL